MVYILILSQLFLIGIALFIGLQFMQMKKFTLHMSKDMETQKEEIEKLRFQLDAKTDEATLLTQEVSLKEGACQAVREKLAAKESEIERLRHLLSEQESASLESSTDVTPMNDIVLPLEGIIKENSSNKDLSEKLKDIQRKTIHLVSFTKKDEDVVLATVETTNNTPEKETQPTEKATDAPLIQQAISVIKLHLSDPSFNVDELSNLLGVSRVSLYKKILAETGDTPIKLIRNLRLEHSIQLLKEQYSVSEVAQKVGFNTPKYFTRYFKEKYGVSPQDYLKQSL